MTLKHADTWPWSTGMFEAPISKLKSLKSNIYYRKKTKGESWKFERFTKVTEPGVEVQMVRIYKAA